MERFLKRLTLFSAITAVLYTAFAYYAVPYLLGAAFGMNVEDQIDTSFKNARDQDYELLVLGNSKLYCGINPDKFDVPAYNFSHNNDTYNQLYYKLVWLGEQDKKIKYLILGTDYFQFNFISDTRNYAYGKWLGSEYLSDYKKNSIDEIKAYVEFLKPYKFRKLLDIPYYKHGLKANGQFIRTGVPSEDDVQTRKFKFLDIQVRYFDKIIAYCKQKNIRVFICLPPMRDAELNQYKPEQIREFNEFIGKRLGEGVVYCDFSKNHRFGFTDFVDMAHLNQQAADDFSQMLNRECLQSVIVSK